MGHGLDAHNNTKYGVNTVHVCEVDQFPQSGPAKDVVDVMSLCEEHEHVERIVEEC